MTEKDLEPAFLRQKFGENDFLNEFRVFEELDSTNEYLKREIENLTGNTLIIALAQNAGKGSKGQDFLFRHSQLMCLKKCLYIAGNTT